MIAVKISELIIHIDIKIHYKLLHHIHYTIFFRVFRLTKQAEIFSNNTI